MLKIQDRDGKTKFTWSDGDEEPIPVKDIKEDEKEKTEEEVEEEQK